MLCFIVVDMMKQLTVIRKDKILFKFSASLCSCFSSLPFLADYTRFLNSWDLILAAVSAGPCWGLNPSADQESVDCNLKKEYVTCLLESSLEVGMNRKVFFPEKWTLARHENMGWCTFSVVPCPLAVCSFSLCCHLHSANTSVCMPA